MQFSTKKWPKIRPWFHLNFKLHILSFSLLGLILGAYPSWIRIHKNSFRIHYNSFGLDPADLG
jgi:hypothetical protein